MSLQCCGYARVIYFRLNRPLLKELVSKVLLAAHLNIYQYIYTDISQKGCSGQLACSRSGADPEIIVLAGEGVHYPGGIWISDPNPLSLWIHNSETKGIGRNNNCFTNIRLFDKGCKLIYVIVLMLCSEQIQV